MGKVKGKSLCIFSPKGGVGKTTLAVNLAGVASLNNKRVLLIDLDLFNGCISMLINQNISKSIFHLADDINNNRFKSISDYIYKYNDNIDILASPKDPRQSNKIDSKYVEMIINRTETLYDLVIVDTSSVLDETNLVALDNVDEILFVLTNDIFHIKNMRNMITIFNDYKIENYKVLLNNSLNFKTPYFSLGDIKKIVGTEIDYTVSESFFIKDITSYYFENKIPVLAKENIRKHKSEINNLTNIINDVFKEVPSDEKK